jgi:hypothetical protein
MTHLSFFNFGREKASITVLKSPDPKADRRKEPRYPTDGWASILVPSASAPRTFTARVLDVSKSGLRLRLPVPLEPGTLLQIEMRSVVTTGAVRHCSSDGEHYSVGVQLDEAGNKERVV